MPVIHGQHSNSPVWDLSRYAFLLNEQTPDTVHSKLWEQAKLNLHTGLYRITDNIYQIRGFDIANISFIKGRTGRFSILSSAYFFAFKEILTYQTN